MTHDELIKRLEAGEVGWPLDGEVYLACFPNEGYQFQPHTDKIKVEGWLVDPTMGEGFSGYNRKIRVEPYSTSLDAAVALCERVRPGLDWTARTRRKHPYKGAYPAEATIWGPGQFESEGAVNAFAPTPAAALLAALLKSTEPHQ